MMGGRFKATFNVFGGNKSQKHFELTPDLNVTGAYRAHKEDTFGYGSIDQPKPRPIESLLPLRPAKSTGNLVQVKNTPPNIRNRAPSISQDPRGPEQGDPIASAAAPSRKHQKNQEKELKTLQNQRLNEQKAREKQAKEQVKQEKLKEKARKEALARQKLREEKQAQEQAKQEKLREKARKEALAEQRAREKQVQEQDKARERARKEAPKVKSNRNDKKKQAPLPQSQPLPQIQTSNVLAASAYSTNTLESSISKSSGPPPYSESPNQGQSQSKDKSSNVIYSKPVDNGSWDIINQHRQQISRPAATAIGGNRKPKQMVMDLNYNFGSTSNNTENTDA